MDYLAEYRRFLEEEKHSSDNTVSSYLRDVHQYSQWLETEALFPEQAARVDIERYIRHLTSLGKSNATVIRSLASLKSFYSFLQGRGVVSANPAKGITLEKEARKLPQILTGKEVELFLEQPDPHDAKGCRDKAMLELLYATGIRV
ncbi:MAG: site-specific integrase, partial [Clostridiales bacterium]|nr:site-specific integrase [Clostridiales bacterium]